MRILKLTHEEIAIIQRALGVAEMKFNELRKNYIEQVVNVRGVDNLSEARKETDIMLAKENSYRDWETKLWSTKKDNRHQMVRRRRKLERRNNRMTRMQTN